MKPYIAVASILAVVGAVVTIVGGAATSFDPLVRDSVRAVGLLAMLAASGVFLLGNRQARERADLASRRRRDAKGLRATAFNLALAGATFFVGSTAVGWAFRWAISSDSLAYWILAGLATLGALAILFAATGYVIAWAFGLDSSSG